ncbi:DUF742 domain-containing protein [Nocardia alni]|uniref:DUF742 domain-containing protein n=1 Tax=Nocardia alni TaxID=2815723 RepID=UPI001C24BB5A|nr:DUF742 domain-containing protein [Nocardia alni]
MTGQHRVPDTRMIELNRSAQWSAPDPSDGAVAPDAGAPEPPIVSDPSEDAGPVVRPYLMTAGRTTPVIDGLRVETLVRATPAALSAPLRFELQTVARLCQHPHSIAEIAAALHVPIGVARVMVSDLVIAGHAAVASADEVSTAAIERIRDLVRSL